jgi:hypothetical protein
MQMLHYFFSIACAKHMHKYLTLTLVFYNFKNIKYMKHKYLKQKQLGQINTSI